MQKGIRDPLLIEAGDDRVDEVGQSVTNARKLDDPGTTSREAEPRIREIERIPFDRRPLAQRLEQEIGKRKSFAPKTQVVT